MDAKNQRRPIVIDLLSRMMQKLASKTTCRGPLCVSTAQGASRMTMPGMEMEPGDDMRVRKKGSSLFKSDIM